MTSHKGWRLGLGLSSCKPLSASYAEIVLKSRRNTRKSNKDFNMIREIVFKLKHDIANDTELTLAELELAAILGTRPLPIKNLADLLVEIDWLHESLSSGATSRVQDILLRLPYPGAIQGYRIASVPATFSIQQIKRLTYFRDVFIIFSGEPVEMMANLRLLADTAALRHANVLTPTGCRISPTASIHGLEAGKSRYLMRLIANHCFLECTDHVVRLAQRPKDVDRMYDAMLKHLQDNYSRPFAASVQMGYKWIEDFIDDRRPPNAYASHSLFGLRGRFFPRMVRALSNHLAAKTGATSILDPFGGVGTLGIECSLLGVKSRSYDLNPFFVKVARAKYRALWLSKKDTAQLEEIREYIQETRIARAEQNSQPGLFDTKVVPVAVCIPKSLSRAVKQPALDLVGSLRGKIESTCSADCAEVALLAIAYYANSILKKYSSEKALRCVWAHLSRILYLDRFMKRLYADEILGKPVSVTFEEGNVKSLSQRECDVSAIVTSPPYTTAIDYIGNDAMAYYATGLQGHDEIEEDMIGSTRLGRISADDAENWNQHVPLAVKKAHKHVREANGKKATCLAKYFYDMTLALRQIHTCLCKGGSMAMVVCGEQEFGSNGAKVKYDVANAITEIGEESGLRLERRIDVDLTKNGDGDIRQEAVLLFEK